MASKNIFYLRTNYGARNLKAGGSVSHTLGVINGFLHAGYTVVCASSAMVGLLRDTPDIMFRELGNPKICSFLGHKLNCLLSNFFFTAQAVKALP